jgi:CBS domain-containing protein
MAAVTVAEVMSRDVVPVAWTMPVPDILEVLMRNGIGAAPVVGPGGTVLGLVSEADLLTGLRPGACRHGTRWLVGSSRRGAHHPVPATVAGDVMGSTLVTARPDTDLMAAIQRMDEAGVAGLVVVDSLGRPQGIVRRDDAPRWYPRLDRR